MNFDDLLSAIERIRLQQLELDEKVAHVGKRVCSNMTPDEIDARFAALERRVEALEARFAVPPPTSTLT